MKKSIIFVILIFISLSCIHREVNSISKDTFLRENLKSSFSDWKNISISKADSRRYFIMMIHADDSFDRQLIFWKEDSVINIRMILPKSMSNVLNLDEVESDSIWQSDYKSLNSKHMKKLINFIYTYKLNSVYFKEKPDRLYFKSESIDLLYLYNPVDTGYLTYNKRINKTRWYLSN